MLETLMKLGLGEKEAKVYLAALSLGGSSAAKIAEKAELNRPNTYVILDKLCQIGLMTSFDKDKVQFFTASEPESLERLLREEEVAIHQKAKLLAERLPELRALQSKVDRPRVLLYDSSEAAAEFYYTKIQEGEIVYAFTNLDILSKDRGQDRDPKLRSAKKIHNKVIYTRDAGPIKNATDPKALREAKFIAKEKFPFDAAITTAPGTGLIYLEEPYSNTMVIIDNKHLAQSMKSIFDLLWATL